MKRACCVCMEQSSLHTSTRHTSLCESRLPSLHDHDVLHSPSQQLFAMPNEQSGYELHAWLTNARERLANNKQEERDEDTGFDLHVDGEGL